MINKIIDGISNALFDEFGTGYKIYTENIEQGLTKPCFIILCVNPTNKRFMGKRHFRTNIFTVLYFPSTSEPMRECNSITERLYQCLEYISIDDDLTHGTKMTCDVVDGVLNFLINYDMFIVEQEDVGEPMNALENEKTVKGW